MKRKKIGRYEAIKVGWDRAWAFIPAPLPPDPAIGFTGNLQPLLEAAVLALGRLDGVSPLLPDRALVAYAFIRKEAVLSSRIEGFESSLTDLLLFELEETSGTPIDDVVEVSNYVAAFEHGLSRSCGGFPVSNRLICEIHGILLRGARGSSKMPGEFRRSQNWIGGRSPSMAVFVPPPPNEVRACMAALERFLHADDDGLPALVRAGLAHVQFETIHPFLDGNGRVGRLLITLLLCQAGVLREPLLYPSLYFMQNRARYYELLNRVRLDGDWEAWLEYFFEGVKGTAEGALATARRLTDLFRDDHARIEPRGRRAGSALRVHEALKSRPILPLTQVRRITGLSFPAASSAMELLGEIGIASELTGNRRNRLFVYDRYLQILNEGMETP